MIIACDPGANGAFAFRDGDFCVALHNANGYDQIYAHLLGRYPGGVQAYIENIGLHQGDQEKFKSLKVLHQHVGRAKLCFELAGIKYTEVNPKKWEYCYGLVGRKNKKALAVQIAQTIYPSTLVTLANADALLIADWAHHQLNDIPFEKPTSYINRALTITKVVERGR